MVQPQTQPPVVSRRKEDRIDNSTKQYSRFHKHFSRLLLRKAGSVFSILSSVLSLLYFIEAL